MAMSTSRLRRASAHSDGTVKDSSYSPRRGPCVKPHTSGAVFKYSTTETRSLLNLSSPQKQFTIAHRNCRSSAAQHAGAFAEDAETLFVKRFEFSAIGWMAAVDAPR